MRGNLFPRGSVAWLARKTGFSDAVNQGRHGPLNVTIDEGIAENNDLLKKFPTIDARVVNSCDRPKIHKPSLKAGRNAKKNTKTWVVMARTCKPPFIDASFKSKIKETKQSLIASGYLQKPKPVPAIAFFGWAAGVPAKRLKRFSLRRNYIGVGIVGSVFSWEIFLGKCLPCRTFAQARCPHVGAWTHTPSRAWPFDAIIIAGVLSRLPKGVHSTME